MRRLGRVRLSPWRRWGPRGIPVLTEMLKDKDWQVRVTAASALGNMVPDPKAAIRLLVELLSDENWDARWAAARGSRNPSSEGEGGCPSR